MILWLHDRGYTYFTIPQLIYPEIFGLIEAKKRRNAILKREAKKAERKAKQARRKK